MKFVTLTLVVDSYPDTKIKVDPSRVSAVGAIFEAGDVVADRCEIFLTAGMLTIRGTVEEVSAALEAATAPPAPAPVVVEPSDLERAAGILDALSRLASHKHARLDWPTIDKPLGMRADPDWDETAGALTVLANRLRGLA